MQTFATARISLTALLGMPVTDAQGQLRGRIKDVETVGGDLFKEWNSEIKQISDANMRADSRRNR